MHRFVLHDARLVARIDDSANLRPQPSRDRDAGAFGDLGRPRGRSPQDLSPQMSEVLARLRQIGRLLEGIGAGEITPGGGGADISPLMRAGVPGLALRTVGEHYFDWHHSQADTLDKIDPQDFRKAVAALAVMGYVLADMSGRLVEGSP